MDEQNIEDPATEFFDNKILEVSEEENDSVELTESDSSTEVEEDTQFIVFTNGIGDTIKVPEDYFTELSTKAGEKAIPTLKDMSRAVWSKKENSRLMQELNKLKTRVESKKKFDGLEEILSDTSLKGSNWTSHLFSEILEQNPGRKEDVQAFLKDLMEGSYSDEEFERSRLDRKEKKLNSRIRTQEDVDHLYQVSNEITNQLASQLGLEIEDVAKLSTEPYQEIVQGDIPTEQELHEVARKIHDNVWMDRAKYVQTKLDLTDEEIQTNIQDFFAILSAHIKNPDVAAEKLAILFDKPKQRAQQKVQNHKNKTQRPGTYIPKPVETTESIEMLDGESPMDYLERRFGKLA